MCKIPQSEIKLDETSLTEFATIWSFLTQFEYQIDILTACCKCTSSQNLWCFIYSLNRLGTTQRQKMRKCMLLFSVILLFVVTSITFAFVLTTKYIVDDIPTKVGQQVKGLKSMKISLHILSKSYDHLDQGNYRCIWFSIGKASIK